MTRILPIRILGVVGYENRLNDLVYCPPLSENSDEATIFFGGDVQDFTESMQSHENNRQYIGWNLDSTSLKIHSLFPNSHTVVVRPSKMEYRTFSCYKNFVPSSNYGVPEHVPMNYAVHHLWMLLQNLAIRLENISQRELVDLQTISRGAIDSAEKITEELNEYNNPSIYTSDWNVNNIRLIGFSKGCVVLNQFLHDFHFLKSRMDLSKDVSSVVDRIREMYWLEGGHSGGKHTWVTSEEILKSYADMGIRTHIHVTPYQINDHKRPWIKKEEKSFYSLLTKLGADVHREVHFVDEEPSLSLHFNVLNVFKK